MRARLLGTSEPWKGETFDIVGEALLGRGEESTVRLEDRAISSRHARIAFDEKEESYFLEDLDSLNGTHLDGLRVRGRERLDRLHVITLAERHEFVFRTLPAEPEAAAAEPSGPEAAEPEAASAAREGTVVDREAPVLPAGLREPAEAPTGKTPVEKPVEKAPAAEREGTRVETEAPALPEAVARRAAERPWVLELLSPPELARPVELHEGLNRLGRAAGADVSIDSPHLSRRHAVLTVAEGRVWLRDEGSSNGSFLEDTRVEDEVEVSAGARLRFGNVEARLAGGPGRRPGEEG